MFSFKNGILNIRMDKPELNLFIDVSFFLLLCTIFGNNATVQGENYFYYAAFFLFFGLTLIKIMMRFKTEETLILPSFTLWYAGFVVLSLASTLWATYPANCMLVISRMVQSMVITFCMAQNYATRARLMRGVRIFSWAGLYTTLYIIMKTSVDTWFSGGFGSKATHLNANTIGMIFTLCVLFSFYFAFYCKEKKYYLFTVVSFMVVVLTSSRKSLLASMAGLILMILMRSHRRTMIWRILAASGLFIVVFYLIMSVPELYSAIGVRIESMFNHIAEDGGDYSMALRQSFIDHASDMFFEKPLLGYGINNFLVQMGFRTGIATYAHNNYYEILADLGIVGFVTYYSFYFYLLVSLFKIWRKSNGSLVKLMIALVVIIMICEYGIVSYYALYIHISLCFAYMFIGAYNQKDDYSKGIPSYLKNQISVYD